MPSNHPRRDGGDHRHGVLVLFLLEQRRGRQDGNRWIVGRGVLGQLPLRRHRDELPRIAAPSVSSAELLVSRRRGAVLRRLSDDVPAAGWCPSASVAASSPSHLLDTRHHRIVRLFGAPDVEQRDQCVFFSVHPGVGAGARGVGRCCDTVAFEASGSPQRDHDVGWRRGHSRGGLRFHIAYRVPGLPGEPPGRGRGPDHRRRDANFTIRSRGHLGSRPASRPRKALVLAVLVALAVPDPGG